MTSADATRHVSKFCVATAVALAVLTAGAGLHSGARAADDAPTPEQVVADVAARAPELLSRYIQIDTTNPPGNEIEGARFLARLLSDEGIESQVFESAPGRGNLYARLDGSGKRRPVILLSHLDVVPVDEDEWNHPPYAGVVADGSVHGRGALDAKGVGITQLLAVVALKRLGTPLARDLILMATADEEAGGRLGAKWMIDNKRGLIHDAEFVLNEGGFIRRSEGRPLVYNLNAAEKGPCWFRVVASGVPGHASRPEAETAVTRLVAALQTLVEWERPYQVGPVVAGYYAAYSVLDEEHARQYRQLDRSLEDPDFRAWFMSDPGAAALVQDTLVPTVLHGSARTNVVPAQAVAEIDSRLLPGHGCESFLADVRALVGGEHVRIEPMGVAFPASQSPLDSDLTKAVERTAAADLDEAVVLPGLQSGFTDSHYFRAVGMHSYGFTPIVVTQEQRNAVHGPNEHVGIAELEAAVLRMVRMLRELAGS